MKNQFLGKVLLLYALANCLQCKHTTVNHRTANDGSGTGNSELAPVSAGQAYTGETISPGTFMDTADKVITTMCDTKNNCTESTITTAGPLDPVPATEIATVSVKSCTIGTGPGGTDTCSEAVQVTKDDLVHSGDTSSSGNDTNGAGVGAAVGAAVGVGAIALTGAIWYFKYFPMASWNVKSSYQKGSYFADTYSSSVPTSSSRRAVGRSLFAWDLDETLTDETYKPDARYAGAGEAPEGWRELTIEGAPKGKNKVWVRKPRFKPGALETLARLVEAGHSVGLVSYNHRAAIGQSLQQELLEYMNKNGIKIGGKDVTIADIQDRFKISAPTVGSSGNPLKDFNATKSIFLDFEGGKATLLENLRGKFSGEFDAVFMADDKDRFLDQARRAKLKEPFVGMKVENNDAAGKAAGIRGGGTLSDVRHLAMARGLTDPAEYAKFVERARGSSGMLLGSRDMEMVMGQFGAKAKFQIAGATASVRGTHGFPDLSSKVPTGIKGAFRYPLEPDSRKPTKEVPGEDFGKGSPIKGFAAGMLILGGVGAAAAIGAGVGNAIDKSN